MLWACQITRAKISCGPPKSICTHCVPLRRKIMLWSDASLSPSLSLARLSAGTFLSLQVILTLGSAAMFFRPGGTIIGARGLSESGSTLGSSLKSLGVPLKAGAGSLSASGTRTRADPWERQPQAGRPAGPLGRQPRASMRRRGDSGQRQQGQTAAKASWGVATQCKLNSFCSSFVQ